ncbi:MAG: haloacid dehalogenase-like hydrolase [Alphaproteobacteria bacterium]|nr:haloacid dehalogenase-like hydrolase [Alphaproteobacteria bacterium]MCL2889797.1 haloacid dehalogenase-like hydrolase [Alphaproteobacteria bacterium]
MKKTKSETRNIVLFDFDGTLSCGDANLAFWKYCFRHSLRPWLFIPVILCGLVLQFIAWIFNRFTSYDARLTRLDILWREMLRPYLTPKMIKKLAPGFIKQHKMARFGWAAEQVAKERAVGNFVIMTSASPAYLLLPLIKDMDFDLIICSEVDNTHPNKFEFFNYGVNKVHSLNAFLRKPYKIVRAYSDSKSDLPMMKLATKQVWIDPKTGGRV